MGSFYPISMPVVFRLERAPFPALPPLPVGAPAHFPRPAAPRPQLRRSSRRPAPTAVLALRAVA